MIMKNEFICNDVLVVHLTVSQIKAIIESALKEATLSKNVQTEMLTIQEVSELTGYKRATIISLLVSGKYLFISQRTVDGEFSLNGRKSING